MTTERIATQDPSLGGGAPLDDPAVVYYTQHTGPWLGLAARALFSQLGRYANPATGQCWPSQERLARDLDTSRQTVSRLCDKLVAAGELLVEQLPGEPGKRNMYTLVGGLGKGWVPTPKPDLEGRSLEHYYLAENARLKNENDEFRRVFAKLISTGEVPDDLSEITLPTDLPNVAAETNMKEEEEEMGVLSSSSNAQVNAQQNLPLNTEIRQWVSAHWETSGWKDPGAAFRFYMDNPERFEVDMQALELKRSLTPVPPIQSTSPYFKDLTPKEKEKYLEELQFQREMGRDNKALLLEGETGHLPDPKDTSEANDDPDVKRGPQ